MKKELREELERNEKKQNQSKLIKVLDKNKGVVKALGIASFIALTGYSAAKLLQDKKMMKKLKKGIKLPSAKKIQNLLSLDGFPQFTTIRSADGVSVRKPAEKAVKSVTAKIRTAAKRTTAKPAGKKTSRKTSK